MITCPTCGKLYKDDPGYFYHSSDCEARWLYPMIEDAKRKGAPPEEIKAMNRYLESVRYVGD